LNLIYTIYKHKYMRHVLTHAIDRDKTKQILERKA